MKKIRLVFMVVIMTILAGCSAKDNKREPSFTIISAPFDWGPANAKIVVDMGEAVKGKVDTKTFVVSGKKMGMDWSTMKPVEVKGNVEIEKTYISDEKGIQADKGDYVTLELKVHPDNILTAPFTFNFEKFLNTKDQVNYEVSLANAIELKSQTLSKLSLVNDDKTVTVYQGIESFVEKDFSYKDEKFGDINLKYALYSPENKENKPLIVLFHGAGEGGTDTSIALVGNKVVALAQDQIQSYFEGAYVLVPQTPDMWMNDGSGQYTKDGTSKYTQAALAMIEQVIAENSGIDAKRVYVGGGSNGGFMTMNLILEKPELFAAAFPICEAYASSWISDAQIEKLKDMPLWFVHAVEDSTVAFEPFTKAIYDRLVNAGHTDVHLSEYEKIVDQSGLYKNQAGEEYRYNDHWSWIVVYNDDVKENNISLFKWLARHSQ